VARSFVGSDPSTGLEVSPSHRMTLAGALVWCVFLDLVTTSTRPIRKSTAPGGGVR